MIAAARFRAHKWFCCTGIVLLVSACGPRDKVPEKAVAESSEAELVAKAGSETPAAAGPGKERDRRSGEKKGAGVQAISFDDISFKMEKDESFTRSMLTKKINDYEGGQIKIRGYILPSFKQDGLTQFVLVRDNMECCFGPGAALYDCVMVQMQPGKSTSFSVRPVTVEGKFKIEEWKDYDGVIRAIYHLTGKSVY